jgi:hypothetical protein
LFWAATNCCALYLSGYLLTINYSVFWVVAVLAGFERFLVSSLAVFVLSVCLPENGWPFYTDVLAIIIFFNSELLF